MTIAVRGDSLAARMSHYLIDEITATPNIDVRTTTQIAAGAGAGKLETLILTDTTTGSTQTVPGSALVILIGAVPHPSPDDPQGRPDPSSPRDLPQHRRGEPVQAPPPDAAQVPGEPVQRRSASERTSITDRDTGLPAADSTAGEAHSAGRGFREDVDKCFRPGFPGFEVVRA